MGNTTSYSGVTQETSAENVKTTSTEETPVTPSQTITTEPVMPTTVQPVMPTTMDPVMPTTMDPVMPTTMDPIMQTLDPVIPVTVQPTMLKKQQPYIHPFIDMINRNCSEVEIINTLQAFCGNIEVGRNSNDQPIYEVVDQNEFLAPVLQVFSYCANNGKKSVVQWLVTNYVPLPVSHDSNYCYFECLRWNHYDIADMIVAHESFYPSMEVLENLISRGKYAQFRKCMASPHLRDDLQTYQYTFMHYIDHNQYTNVGDLLRKIKQRISNQNVQINDQVHLNPRLVQQQAQSVPVVHPTVSTINDQFVVQTETPMQMDSDYVVLEVAHEVPESNQEDQQSKVSERMETVQSNQEVQQSRVSEQMETEDSNLGLHHRNTHNVMADN
jgi:hypothetical protein